MSAYTRMAAAVAFGLAGVLGAGEVAAQVKVGAVLSVTGPAAFLGDPEKKTLEMYVENINAAGGVNGQQAAARRLRRRRRRRTRRAPSPPAWSRRTRSSRMVGGTTTGATMAMIPVAEDARDAVHLARRRRRDHRAGARSGCSRPRTPTAWPARRSSPTCKARNLTTIALDLRRRRLRQLDARPVPRRGRRKYGIEIVADESYGAERQRHDAAAHQDQGQPPACRRCSTPASARARRS